MGERCLIWGTPAETSLKGDRDAYWVSSPRVGVEYVITGSAAEMIANGYLDARSKAILTTALVDRRSEGDDASLVDSTLLEECKEVGELTHVERAERLLRHIADRERLSPGDPVQLDVLDPAAMAYSESWKHGQLRALLEYLQRKRWLELQQYLDSTHCTVTVEGHEYLAGAGENRNTTQVFVAMWFDEELREAYDKGIDPAIRDAGFIPFRIDQKKDANKIDEDIISEIRKSRFVVADMTHGKDGVRGSVYFEAGFARGYGLRVIYSCRKDCLEDLPFDTRQYHHIVWEKPEDLRGELVARIQARIDSQS